MDRTRASEYVAEVRSLMEADGTDTDILSDGSVFLFASDEYDRLSGQQVFEQLISLLDVFRLTEPIEGVSKGELWGPSLVRPSKHSYISPWVLHGEPCVTDSRVPTAALYALSTSRGLSTSKIRDLYPQLQEEKIDDAIKLEERLRAA